MSKYSLTKVYTIQHALGLTIDGDLGPKTTEAIKSYQKSVGLVPDGIPGTQTAAIVTGKQIGRAHV